MTALPQARLHGRLVGLLGPREVWDRRVMVPIRDTSGDTYVPAAQLVAHDDEAKALLYYEPAIPSSRKAHP